MKPPEQDVRLWERAAKNYARFMGPALEPFRHAAREMFPLQGGARVLDVAAGSGDHAFALAAAGARVTAIDFAEGFTKQIEERAAQGGQRIEAHVMDGHALTFPDATFDAVHSLFGMMMFEDRPRALAEAHRVLARDGTVLVSSWAMQDNQWMEIVGHAFEVLGGPEPGMDPEEAAFMAWGTTDALEDALEHAGFAGVEVVPVERPITWSSPEDAWQTLADATVMLAHVPPDAADQIPAMQERFQHRIAKIGGPGPTTITSRALLASGRKP